jgi:two-component system NarL family sensor kinase
VKSKVSLSISCVIITLLFINCENKRSTQNHVIPGDEVLLKIQTDSLIATITGMDSVNKVILPDSILVDKINQKALEIVYSEPKQAYALAKASKEFARSIHYSFGEIRALLRMGIYYDVENKDSMALVVYAQALELSKKSNDSMGIASSLNNSGLIYWKQNQLNQALESFKKTYAIFNQLKRYDNLSNVSNNIGLIYEEIGKHDIAMDWYRKTLSINRNISGSTNNLDVYANIGNLFVSQNQKDSATFYLKKAIEGYREQENWYGLAKSLNNYGNLLSHQSPRQSIACFTESMNIAEKLNNTSSYVSTSVNLAMLYKRLKKEDSALVILEHAYPLLQQVGNSELSYKICDQLSNSYFLKNEFVKGKELSDEFRFHFDKYYNELSDKNIIEFEKKLKLKEANQKAYQAENEKLKVQIYSRKKNYWIFGLSASLLFILLTSIIWIQKRKTIQEKEKNKAVLAEREKGFKAILKAQEYEKERIARDLHDSVGQKLSVVKMQFSMSAGKEQTTKIAGLLDESIEEIRTISHNLLPPNLKNGLAEAVENLKNEFNFSNRLLQIVTIISENAKTVQISEHDGITLYRIVQEFVNNTVKYAKASYIHIRMDCTEYHFHLFLQDDGTGFSTDKGLKTNGIGLKNIGERIKQLHGTIEIDSENGTSYKITIPL